MVSLHQDTGRSIVVDTGILVMSRHQARNMIVQVKELCTYFSVVKMAKNVRSGLAEHTMKCFEWIESSTRRKNLEKRFKIVATDCQDLLNEFLSNDEGKNLFKACEALFSPTKLVILKSKDASGVTKYVTKYKNDLCMLKHIPISNFIFLHSLFVDNLVDALKANPKRDYEHEGKASGFFYSLSSSFVSTHSKHRRRTRLFCLQWNCVPQAL